MALSRDRVATVLALSMIPALAAAGGDPDAGREKAVTCSGCHGERGISVNDIWPNLAGQKAGYLAKALRDFRAGRRTDPIMATFARHLSDDDITDLAAYYAALPRRAADTP